MRRMASFLAVFALVLVSLATLASPHRVLAQESTPAAGPPPEEEGVTFTPLGFAAGVALPSPGDLILVDVTLEPGAVSKIRDSDPSSGMLYVKSGEFTVVNTTTSWTVTRGKVLAEAMASGAMDDDAYVEMIAAGQEATLSEGDVAYVPGNVAGEIRNDGDVPAEGMIFVLAPGGTLGGAPEGAPAP
ncbi:MAG: cupin domain-containing protein, partial [Thermomicrobiales bacterium]|nr:cupin domain-containing protein [Thermomicrobiales bacterium]